MPGGSSNNIMHAASFQGLNNSELLITYYVNISLADTLLSNCACFSI